MVSFAWQDVVRIAIQLVVVVLSIVLHELAHGYVAWRLGDPTAKEAGRLTLNPVKHLDPFGSIILPLCMSAFGGAVFAYAKPVPYNPMYFKNRRRDELAVALAGPLSNLLQALVAAGICWGITGMASRGAIDVNVYYWASYVAYMYCMVNLWLMFFNLIPLPPLDGANIIAFFLSDRAMAVFYKVKSYSMFILILILFFIPYVTPFDPMSWYFSHTAGALANVLLPW